MHLIVSQEHTAIEDSRLGATRLEVGPRESRAGSRVPRYTSQPCRASHVSGRGCTRPEGSSRRGRPSHAQVEAPCSALAVDTAEERLCPCTSGSTMLRAGDKQLRAAPRSYQPQGAQSSASGLTAMPSLGRGARGGWTRGLRSDHAQALATQPGLPGQGLCSGHAQAQAVQTGLLDLVVACLSQGLGEGRYGNCLNIKGDS